MDRLRQPWRLIAGWRPARSLHRGTVVAIVILVVLATASLVIGLATATAALLGIAAAIVLAAVLVWAYANLDERNVSRHRKGGMT